MVRLLILDAHPVMRSLARTASSYEDGLALSEKLLPDLLVLSLSLPVSHCNRSRVSLEDVRHIHMHCGAPIIALSSPAIAPEMALLLLHEGTAQALLDKDALLTHLSDAERAVQRGEHYAYFQGKRHDVDSLVRGLDVFELKRDQAYLLELLAENACLHHIAERLGCSKSNVYLLLQGLTMTLHVPHYKYLVEAAARMGILSGGRVVSTTGVRQFNKSTTFASLKTVPSALFLGHSFTSGARAS